MNETWKHLKIITLLEAHQSHQFHVNDMEAHVINRRGLPYVTNIMNDQSYNCCWFL